MGESARQEPAISGLVCINNPALIDAPSFHAQDRRTALHYYTDIRFLIETFLSLGIVFSLRKSPEGTVPRSSGC